jgi:phytoene dehydrogenase-like protein
MRYDAVIVGGGHNGLVAATLLARAGHSVLVLERRAAVGGAAVSESPFPGVAARVSRYAYLVSLFPRALLRTLGIEVEFRPRAISSYTPDGKAGLLIGAGRESPAGWERFHAMLARVAQRVFPTLTEPLRSREEMRRLIGDDAAWRALFEEPLSELIERSFDSDLVRGLVLTDAAIGTFAPADDPELRQNRCFLYHSIGNGTGRWDVPVGGMGALTAALTAAARRAGARIEPRSEVAAIASDGAAAEVACKDGRRFECRHVMAAVAPAVLARLLGSSPPPESTPEGSQLKINMVVKRLPGLRDPNITARQAFAGTFHVAEGYEQLRRAYEEAAAGVIPQAPPCELYCHTLTDPSILSAELRTAGAHTLTVFGLHMPARLFGGAVAAEGIGAAEASRAAEASGAAEASRTAEPSWAAEAAEAKERAVQATLRAINSVLAEPLEECLWLDPAGVPCLEARSPPELEAELGLPGGHIFHRDLSWPFAESDEEVGAWGVETVHRNVWICGAGARRGGGVSGIPGHNAAQAVLGALRSR